MLLVIADIHQIVHRIFDWANDCFNLSLYLESFVP